MSTDTEIDVSLLKSEIKKTYASVSDEPDDQIMSRKRLRAGTSGRERRSPARAGSSRARSRRETVAATRLANALGASSSWLEPRTRDSGGARRVRGAGPAA